MTGRPPARQSGHRSGGNAGTVSVASATCFTGKLAAPEPGAYTLLCFVDGKFFRREPIRLSGRYAFNTRGLAPGTHRITLQVVDASGRVGSAPQTLTIGN